MTTGRFRLAKVIGLVEAPGRRFGMAVIGAAPHSLFVSFPDRTPDDREMFESAELAFDGRTANLGRCRFIREIGPDGVQGRLYFLDELYDFSAFFKKGRITVLKSRFQQLPMLWARKADVRPAFRDYVSGLIYDLQVYRELFDEVDRELQHEPIPVRRQVRRLVLEDQSDAFFRFFDKKLDQLASEIEGFTRKEHERHGFYFRKQVWDIILCSPFLTRTNLKPRGYAGDSKMMQMIYRNEFFGPGIFAQLMHKHPLESSAARAVRNRRVLIPQVVVEALSDLPLAGEEERYRVMSVACGPAWELRDLLLEPGDCARYEFTLLDQDTDALDEAREGVRSLETEFRAEIRAQFVQDSVRTMLRTGHLSEKFGRFHAIYSMGLFDYLTDPVARAVLTKLYEMLVPGGVLLVGNFHFTNPTRAYMEYWMDWRLIYRREADFMALADRLPGAEPELRFEDTGAQMFLEVRRPRRDG